MVREQRSQSNLGRRCEHATHLMGKQNSFPDHFTIHFSLEDDFEEIPFLKFEKGKQKQAAVVGRHNLKMLLFK